MTLNYKPMTNENISTTDFRYYYGNMFDDKIIDGLTISALGEGLIVRVMPGTAIVDGLYYRLNEETKLTFTKNTSSEIKTYYICLRLNHYNINSPISLEVIESGDIKTEKGTGVYDFTIAKVTLNISDITITDSNVEVIETKTTDDEPWYVILTNSGTFVDAYASLGSLSIVSSSGGFKTSDITLNGSVSVRFNIKGIFSIQYEIYTSSNNGTKYSGSRVYCRTGSDYVMGQHENRSITCSTNASASVTLNTYEGDTAINAYIYNNQSQSSIGVLYITKIG